MDGDQRIHDNDDGNDDDDDEMMPCYLLREVMTPAKEVLDGVWAIYRVIEMSPSSNVRTDDIMSWRPENTSYPGLIGVLSLTLFTRDNQFA